MLEQGIEVGIARAARSSEPSLSDEIDNLAAAIEFADDRTDRLTTRIHPILQDERAEGPMSPDPTPASTSSERTLQLRALVQRVQQLGRRIDVLGDRVDL